MRKVLIATSNLWGLTPGTTKLGTELVPFDTTLGVAHVAARQNLVTAADHWEIPVVVLVSTDGRKIMREHEEAAWFLLDNGDWIQTVLVISSDYDISPKNLTTVNMVQIQHDGMSTKFIQNPVRACDFWETVKTYADMALRELPSFAKAA